MTNDPNVTGKRTALEPDYTEQALFYDPRTHASELVIIGAGGIGSNLGPVLAAMGMREFPITIIDPDIVTKGTNVANSTLFRPKDAGRYKAHVLEERLRELGAADVRVVLERYDGSQLELLKGIVASGLDNMPGRNAIWHQGVKDNIDVDLYLDGRTGGTRFTVIALSPWDEKRVAWYEKFQLFDQEKKGFDAPCGGRNMVHAATGLSAIVAACIANATGERPYPKFYSHDLGIFVKEDGTPSMPVIMM